jgi:perosamine synthetase
MSEPVLVKDRRFIPVAKPWITDCEIEAASKVVRSGWISAGQQVEEFEHEFAAAHGKRYGVACNSGTTALQLAITAAGVEAGDRVACPTMTMVACPNAIISAGGNPFLLDSVPGSGCMDLDEIPARRYRPKAILYVHLYGVPVEFDADTWIAKAIEDCAEAHYGSFENGSPVGSRGDFACFSFFANMIIACGEGGMVLTNSAEDAERMRGLRAHAFTKGEHFHHREHALGVRMTDMQAAIGLSQHRRREQIIQRRRRIFRQYMAGPWPDWVRFQWRTPGSADWVFPILVREGFGLTRDMVRQHLGSAGIETRSWFKPMHRQPHLKRFADGELFPVADDLARRGLYLPIYPEMTDDDVSYVIETVAAIRA